MKLPRLHCTRCDYEWIPRKETLPVRCPQCASPYWNRKRQTPLRDDRRES